MAEVGTVRTGQSVVYIETDTATIPRAVVAKQSVIRYMSLSINFDSQKALTSNCCSTWLMHSSTKELRFWGMLYILSEIINNVVR